MVDELTKKQVAYIKLKGISLFGFPRHITTLISDEVKDGASKLTQTYPKDVEKDLEDEVTQFLMNF